MTAALVLKYVSFVWCERTAAIVNLPGCHGVYSLAGTTAIKYAITYLISKEKVQSMIEICTPRKIKFSSE
jgi:hypothetical protein